MEETKIHSTHLLGIPVEVYLGSSAPIDQLVIQDPSITRIRGIIRTVSSSFIHLECRYYYWQHDRQPWYWEELDPPVIKAMRLACLEVAPMSMCFEKDVGHMEMNSILARSIDDCKWMNPRSKIPEIENIISPEGKYLAAMKFCNGDVEAQCTSRWFPIDWARQDPSLEITLYDDEQSARKAAQQRIEELFPDADSL